MEEAVEIDISETSQSKESIFVNDALSQEAGH